ncbi:putative death-receptor fusion protein-domain-containing protein [Naematelia encephala]|uniref:Putative death-receptor fusion protein-domain-containing protein n=1 Tax=Naematelia encephala TaxID=71784 RepID=A0A1Y2BJ73_9TREE|nr:putative death-receptor fusion protein-domain-containing protein [Naematelia encephala]
MMTEEDAVRMKLVEGRKALSKVNAHHPLAKDDQDRLIESLDYALSSFQAPLHLDLLSYDLSLLRQLESGLQLDDQQALADTAQVRLQPALLPDGVLGSLIRTSLDGPTKVHQLRAGDVLQAVAKVVDLLPPPVQGNSKGTSDILAPLFLSAARSGISVRSNLKIISVLLNHVPSRVIPDNLLGDLLDELTVGDLASLRCGIIVGLLCRRSEAFGNDEAVIDPLLPYFDSRRSAAVLTNLVRYLLPPLFKARPSTLQIMLERLRSPSNTDVDWFPAWISIASLGVASGHISLENLPRDDLENAIGHEDPEVRLRAFQLVTGGKGLLRQSTVALIKQCMLWNEVLPGAGARSDFISACHAFFVVLKAEHQANRRATRKAQYKSATPSGSSMPVLASDDIPLEAFLDWFLDDFIDPGLVRARRYPVVRSVLALSILERYLEIFGETDEIHRTVFTKDRVEMLFACQASEFTEVRWRSRAILESARVPLPGYEAMSSSATQALVVAALSSLNHPRKTQAEAGKAALCILFKKLVSYDQHLAIDFVDKLVDRVEEHLVVAENDLVKGMEECPLHGPLAAVREVLTCLEFSTLTSSEAWSGVFHKLIGIVNRVWNVTSAVISLSPSKENGETGRTDHEIARAYEVLAENDEEDEINSGHTGLLSGCWRATTEAGLLLSALITLPLASPSPEMTIWSREDVDRAGQCFLVWLHEIRHRGTFSKLANAFGRLVDCVKGVKNMDDLCVSWLEHELETITQDSLSTTRRSAALPYSVLALVSSDKALLDKAFDRLVDLARVDNTKSSDITKVHAFNIMKIVLLDAKQTKLLDRYFERAVMTSLEAFSSPNWNVRNVGLILFSTLVHRSLTPTRGTQDLYASRATLATRQTLAAWHAKYPKIVPHITQHLRRAGSSLEKGSVSALSRHSPLFPILIIVRSLKWSDRGAEVRVPLLEAVEPYLSNQEWQIRQVSAQAISSLLSPAQAVQRAKGVTHAPLTQLRANAIHGNILLLRELVANVIEWSSLQEQERQKIEETLLMTLRRSDPNTVSPLIVKTALECVLAYRHQVSQCSAEVVDMAVRIARSVLRRPRLTPGYDLLVETASILLADNDGTIELDLLLSSSEDACLICLNHLAESPDRLLAGTLRTVLKLATSPNSGEAIQIAALEALVSAPWEVAGDANGLKEVEIVLSLLENSVQKTKSVPLREAALPALGWAMNFCQRAAVTAAVDGLADQVLRYSGEQESQPARFSSLRTLEHLSSLLFEPTYLGSSIAVLKLHQALLRLLQDDDEGIRLGSAEIIQIGLGTRRPVVQAKALEMWWTWIGNHLGQFDPQVRAIWLDWFWDLAIDEAGFKNDLATLSRPAQHPTDVLFEVEPPNLFRDPLADASFAAFLLRNQAKDISVERQGILEKLDRQAESVADKPKSSPIEDAFEARRVLSERIAIHRHLLEPKFSLT